MTITSKLLQYKDVTNYISEEVIAKYYLGIGIHKPFNSFFRKDPTPSAGLYYYHGRLWYNDFRESMTLVDLILRVKGWSYKDFMSHLMVDLYTSDTITLKTRKVSKTKSNRDTILNVKYRDWQQWDLDYWGQGGITKEWLISADIKPISYYFIYGRTKIAHKWQYTYDFYNHKNVFRRKLYAPKHEDIGKKWLSNIDTSIVQNYKNLPNNGKLLIITSSLKDCGVISCNWDTPTLAGNNELSFMPERFIWKLKQRFNDIIIFYDNDKGGHIGANRNKQKFGFNSIFLPDKSLAKDPFAFCELHGWQDFKRLKQYML